MHDDTLPFVLQLFIAAEEEGTAVVVFVCCRLFGARSYPGWAIAKKSNLTGALLAWGKKKRERERASEYL